MRILPFVLCACLAATAACSGDDACDPNAEECTYETDVSTITVGAGVEDEDTCQSWTLNNPTELWVNGISQTNDGGYHHANWFFVPDNDFDLPDGTWSCNDNDFIELQAALLGGYLFALSTQSHEESQVLPGGSAIRIPPYSRIIGSSHLLNASTSDVETTMHLAIHTIPPDELVAKMAPARIQYHDLDLDPDGRSSFTTECLIDQAHQDTFGTALDYKLHYVLFHYHRLGVYMQLEVAGGPNDGEVIARHEGYGENFGQALDPPFDLAAEQGQGIRFTCGYDNPGSERIHWGIGDQEMCVVALQAETGLAFEGDVAVGDGAMTGVVDGETKYAGACGLTAFPWDFTKPGGTGH